MTTLNETMSILKAAQRNDTGDISSARALTEAAIKVVEAADKLEQERCFKRDENVFFAEDKILEQQHHALDLLYEQMSTRKPA